ncbi:MAG TPA: Ig-like domain-containing protein [Lachnospiraceae bacterium]|nr:Ig-like domain-containing protein [Lachnospiraceae bacterium]
MRSCRKLMRFVAFLFIVVMLFPNAQFAKAADLKETFVVVYVEDTHKMSMKSGSNANAKWSSEDKHVATVNSKGVVTAKKEGKAFITAKAGGKEYSCLVEVRPKKEKDAIKNLKVSSIRNGYDIIVKIKNENPETLPVVRYNVSFYDKSGKRVIQVNSFDIYNLESGQSMVTSVSSGFVSSMWRVRQINSIKYKIEYASILNHILI